MRVLLGLVLAGAAFAQAPVDTLKRADRALRSSRSTDTELVALVPELLALEASAPPEDRAKLRGHVTKLVLRLLHAARDDEPREPVRWAAAVALGRLEPSEYGTAKGEIARGLLRETKTVNSHRVWEAVARSLLVLDPDDAAGFVEERFLDPNTDERSWRRTRGALLALVAAPRPDARQRHESVKRLLAQFQSFPFHVEEDEDWVADLRDLRRGLRRKLGRHAEYWADLRPLVQRLLRRYTADPRTGALARDVDDGFEVPNLERMKVWNGRHKSRAQSPWVDPGNDPLPRTARREAREPGQEFYLRYTAPWTVYAAMRAPPEPERGEDPLAARRVNLRDKVLPGLLREASKDAAWQVRGMAAIGAARCGLDGLWAALDAERDERVREAIAWGLLLRRDKEFAGRWRQRAGDGAENPQVRAVARLALGLLGDAAFLRGLSDDDPELRGCAVAALGLCGEKDDAPMLAALATGNDRAPGLRGAAASALVACGTPALTELLLRAVGQKDDPVRRAAAAHALAGTVAADDGESIRAMGRWLLEPKGTFGGHRAELALALADVGGTLASGVLTKALDLCAKDTTRCGEYGTMLLALGALDPGAVAERFPGIAHEWDAGAAALAVARGGVATSIPSVRARLADAQRIYLPSALQAVGWLGDQGSLGPVRLCVEQGPCDRVVAEGGIALARIRGADAGDELLALWPRALDRADYAGLARAFGIAGPGGAEAELRRIAKEGRPLERAFALHALVSMAAPGDETVRRMRRAFFAYDAPRTVTLLARFGDSFFLAETDE